ncbi:MAG: carbohydrate ABC transporter permease [Eubacterium sp.]|nr:carbohydrate ABC transporter permease [Eubacterium sp.]
MKKNDRTVMIIKLVLLSVFAVAVLYPLAWMIGSSFKPEATIFKDLGVIPKQFTVENYFIGWKANGRTSFSVFFRNSLFISILYVIGNLLSCVLTAYPFARLRFRGQNIMFALMMMTLMIPQHATIVPQYVYFYKLGWIDTFLPMIIPKFLATDTFFIYMVMQFIRGIPRELDEAAIVDGCSVYSVFTRIILPLTRPALVTTTIFTFMWSWNDFFTQLIYLRSAPKYTVTLGLRMFVDSTAKSAFGAMFAMSTLSIVPMLILFVLFQRQLVEGIATSGLKG